MRHVRKSPKSGINRRSFMKGGLAAASAATVTAGLLAIKRQGWIGFIEMIMRADLDWAIAGIGDGQGRRRAAGIDLDLARCGEELSRDHDILTGSARGR